MSLPSVEEKTYLGTPWPHVWPYNQHQSLIFSSLKCPHDAVATDGCQPVTDTLNPSSPPMSPSSSNTGLLDQVLTSTLDRHNCQSILHGNLLITRPTFSQIFIMSHTSPSISIEEQGASRYPMITTRHRLPKAASTGLASAHRPVPHPMLLPQRRKFSVEIPVVRNDLSDSPPCSPIIYAKNRDQDSWLASSARNASRGSHNFQRAGYSGALYPIC